MMSLAGITQWILNISYTIDDTVTTDVAMPKNMQAGRQTANLIVERGAACYLGQSLEFQPLHGWQEVPSWEKMGEGDDRAVVGAQMWLVHPEKELADLLQTGVPFAQIKIGPAGESLGIPAIIAIKLWLVPGEERDDPHTIHSCRAGLNIQFVAQR